MGDPVPQEYHHAPTAKTENAAEAIVKKASKINLRTREIVSGEVRAVCIQ
jgi:hypothetical protein